MMSLTQKLQSASRHEKIEYLELIDERNKRLARKSLLAFTEYTKPDYKANWHHIEYAKKLDGFANGDIKKLMVFMPPQEGKSEQSSRRLPAKLLGDNPDLKIGLVSYNHTIAATFNRDIQRIIDNEKYHKLYPNTILNSSNVRAVQSGYLRNSDIFEIVNHKGSLVSVGVGGALTSRTIDFLIIDDLYKDAMSAWSETVRSSVQDWYDSVAKTRLHNDSQQLIVFTRWHEEDLAGVLLRREDDWEVVIYPAIKQDAPNENDPRQDGEALWPERHSLESLEAIRKQNPIVFDSLYQQNPTPKEGLLLPSSELKRFKKEQLFTVGEDGKKVLNKPTTIISKCDTADEGSDSLCQPVGYVYGKDIYVPDVIFTQDAIEVTQPRSALLLDTHNVAKADYESNNGGKGYAQVVKSYKKGNTNITWTPTVSNKHTRIIMKSGFIKEHMYFLVDEEQDDEYRQYFYELTHYPKNGKAKHDDAADGTTGLAEMTTQQGWGFGNY